MSALVRTTQDCLTNTSAREQPLLHVRRVYAGFVQGLFYAAPIGSYHWEPDSKVSEIIITDENPIQVEVVGKRPAVTFTRGPVQFFGLGLDDLLSYDQSTGTKKKSVLLPGTMSINCCSRNDLESEYLASVIAEQLWMHRELLMRAGFFEIGRNFMIGAPSPAGSIVAGDGADEWYVTTITSPFHISRTSQFSPLNTRIAQAISVNLSTQARFRAVGTTGPAMSPPGSVDPPWLQQTEDEEAASITEAGAPAEEQLPKVPHPLDPTKKVSIRSVHPYRPGIRPPAIRGRTIPVSHGDVEGSAKLTFKV